VDCGSAIRGVRRIRTYPSLGEEFFMRDEPDVRELGQDIAPAGTNIPRGDVREKPQPAPTHQTPGGPGGTGSLA